MIGSIIARLPEITAIATQETKVLRYRDRTLKIRNEQVVIQTQRIARQRRGREFPRRQWKDSSRWTKPAFSASRRARISQSRRCPLHSTVLADTGVAFVRASPAAPANCHPCECCASAAAASITDAHHKGESWCRAFVNLPTLKWFCRWIIFQPYAQTPKPNRAGRQHAPAIDSVVTRANFGQSQTFDQGDAELQQKK